MGVIRKAERLSNGNFEIFFEIRDESNGFALALLMIAWIRDAVLHEAHVRGRIRDVG
jgi:hypothetical protein